jgi:hypothetical protein
MKLRAITLNNVRRFTTPAAITGIGDGLNVLCEPNEHGKSTLFDAVQALFFKPHSSADKEIKALRPHAGGAPEVTIEVETAEGIFQVHKRWTAKACATVRQNGRLIAQADAAEAWIGQLLGSGTGGPSGLVWVRQGMTALTAGSAREQAAGLEARRDLMSSVSEAVEAMTGGRRMDMALARCKAELSVLATATGQKKAGGPWKSASDRVEALLQTKAELSATAAALHDALDKRKRKTRELAELNAPEAAAARKEQLDAARTAHRDAERHAEINDAGARKVTAARLALEGMQAQLDALRSAVGECTEAEKLASTATAARTQAQRTHEAAHLKLKAALTQLETVQQDLKAAQDTNRQALYQQAARDGARLRSDLEKRIAGAEAARKAMETASAARTGPDSAALRKLETLFAAVMTATATRDAMATQLVVTYTAGGDGAVRMGGAALDGGRSYPVPRGAVLDITGIGRVEIRPGADAQDDDAVATAQRALDTALGAVKLPDLAAARDAADARALAQTRFGEGKALLDGLAPDGIDALHQALAVIPVLLDQKTGPDPTQTDAALSRAQDAMTAAQTHRDGANEILTGAREAIARTTASEAGATDRLARAKAALAGIGAVSADGLSAAVSLGMADLATAQSAHAEQMRTAPDLARTDAALRRAQSVSETAQNEIARLRPELAVLDERIGRGSGDAVEERLAECAQELSLAESELERIAHEVAVLRRLQSALDLARTEARERYFEPVATELKPLLQLLWPDAELTWGHDTLLPEALTRNGQTEAIDVLSGGTQEQLALLVRLAFARMLAKDGRHAPVLLDDALVFTDDDRIERMFDALHRQAGDLQIIVLSCRQRAFRQLGGHTLRLAKVTE